MPAIDLKIPITKGERTVTTLVLPERVLVRHLMAGDGLPYPSVKRELAILSALTGESDIVLRELDTADWVVLQAAVNKLFTNTENEKPEKSKKK